MRLIPLPLFCAFVLCLLLGAAQATPQEDPERNGPLPHWPKGGPIEPDPDQPLLPYALSFTGDTPPTSGLIESQAEYDPTKGILFRYSTSAWPDVVTDCVAAITGDPTKDDRAYVVVGGTNQQASATSQFTAAGADMSKVEFFIMPSESIWLRDYGPNFILNDGAPSIVDGHYYLLDRTKDNFVPCLLGEDHFLIPVYHMGMNTSAGGNFLTGPNRSAFVSSVIFQYNPGFSQQYIAEMYQTHIGIDTLHVMPQLPTSVDLTGHIDMWMYIIDEDTVMISEFIPGSNPTAVQITEDAVTYMTNLGFDVHRVPDQVGSHPYYPSVHYTYTNSLRINDRIFISSYGDGDPYFAPFDQTALAAYQAAAPGCQIIQIPTYDIIWAAGAMHCITANVPLRTDPEPAAHLVSPDGGEFLVCGDTHEIVWTACDDTDVTGIDLYYSLDGGSTFPHLIASGLANDSREEWTVPDVASTEDDALVKVVANDGGGNSGEDVCESVFTIRDACRKVYDFSAHAGVDRWGWGSDTYAWSELDGIRRPASVSTEIDNIDPDAYTQLALSDATGGDTDPNRYRSSLPSYGAESTHIFEFTINETPELILDIEILWEGYGDGCSHVEVFVWDESLANWSDGRGTAGENMYMANFAGNRDARLVGHVRDNFDRYVDGDRKLAILIYTERDRKKSFHDYLAVTVSHEYTLAVDTATIPASTGGAVNFDLFAGTGNANRPYLMVGSVSGTEPGTLLPGGLTVIPLNRDWFTDFILARLNTYTFTRFWGTLDASGQATATLNAPPIPSWTGTVMHFAYACAGSWDFASNAVAVEVVP